LATPSSYVLDPSRLISPVNTNDYYLQDFVAGLALAPPEVTVDEAQLAEYRREMEEAQNQPLPDEDDADL
jgi:hypothetical protein